MLYLITYNRYARLFIVSLNRANTGWPLDRERRRTRTRNNVYRLPCVPIRICYDKSTCRRNAYETTRTRVRRYHIFVPVVGRACAFVFHDRPLRTIRIHVGNNKRTRDNSLSYDLYPSSIHGDIGTYHARIRENGSRV